MSKITVNTKQKRFPVAPDLYGLFFEDISHAGDGGLYPEMLRNRSFEDSLIPEGCTTKDEGKTFVSPTGWIDEFNNGEGMNDWVERGNIMPTPIPGWYCEQAFMELYSDDTLNANRKVSLKVNFQKGGTIRNIGYRGISQKEGEQYHLYFFAKSEKAIPIKIKIEYPEEDFIAYDLVIDGTEWKRYNLNLYALHTTKDGIFTITALEEGTLLLGFISLMPSNTFMGHGLRLDLAEKLRDMNPSFLRFPGGCIVEGFTKQTAMYFKNMIGPVWERPSHWLLWHYRTTNGLGFHEYLQLCEDLQIEALYVCNCGMTCQGRGPYFFNEQELDEICEDTLNAIEYAIGDNNTKWGSYRAKMGHPQPFSLKYLEIGNENSGSEYAARYEKIRQAVMEKYPEMIIVTNDRDETIKADIIDDHYYNMPEFYAENLNLYDQYDRKKPDIFVGEFAVNQTYEGQLRAAVSEAMFMIGFERNQDVVKLVSYAPLFEHVHFYSWFPNLIIFDNLDSYVIPTYYVFKLFGGSRGTMVVDSKEEVGKIYRDLHGLPMISGDYGLRYRNAFYNAKPVRPTKELWGNTICENDAYTLVESTDEEYKKHHLPFKVSAAVALGDDVNSKTGVFEAEIFYEEGKEIGVGMLCAPKPLSFYDRYNPNPRDPWGLWNMEPIRWMIKDGEACVMRGGFQPKPMAETVKVELKNNEFNTLRYELNETCVNLYLNDSFIQTVELPHYQAACSVVTDTEQDIYIKLVNFDEKAELFEINLDCDVLSDYSVNRMYGAADAENTIDANDCIKDETVFYENADRTFTYEAKALSVNVIRLKKA